MENYQKEVAQLEGLKFALATNRFNSSSYMGFVYTMWAVILIVYNLLPKYATKK